MWRSVVPRVSVKQFAILLLHRTFSVRRLLEGGKFNHRLNLY